jgi:hypothetical protein
LQISNQFHSSFSFNQQNFFDNLSPQDKQIVRKALATLPDNLLPKALQALNQIPPDKNYLQNLLNKIDEFKPKEGFSVYA